MRRVVHHTVYRGDELEHVRGTDGTSCHIYRPSLRYTEGFYPAFLRYVRRNRRTLCKNPRFVIHSFRSRVYLSGVRPQGRSSSESTPGSVSGRSWWSIHSLSLPTSGIVNSVVDCDVPFFIRQGRLGTGLTSTYTFYLLPTNSVVQIHRTIRRSLLVLSSGTQVYGHLYLPSQSPGLGR